MDLNRLTRDADDLIRKVVSRYNQLYVPKGTISQLELDLMLDDLRKLYDTFKTIGYLNISQQETQARPQVSVTPNHVEKAPAEEQKPERTTTTSAAETPAPAFQPAETPAQAGSATEIEPESAPRPETAQGIANHPENPESETVAFEQKSAEKHEVADTAPATKPEGAARPSVNDTHNSGLHDQSQPRTDKGASPMLADKFNTGNKSLSEAIASSQQPAGPGPRLMLQPIADLNTGIGLNDKFSFISELFANNPAQYEEAISRINRAVNLDEANWIMQKYHIQAWEYKQETLTRLMEFIKRRFI